MNRPMTCEEVIQRICQDRQIVNKQALALATKELKQRSDEVKFKKEIESNLKEVWEI